jgi:hypothetical protein
LKDTPPRTDPSRRSPRASSRQENELKKGLAALLREVNRAQEISRNQLVEHNSAIRSNYLDDGLQLLLTLGVLKRIETGTRSGYSLRALEEGGPKDFLVLGAWKAARMSDKGDRSLKFRTSIMALRNGVTGRPCGSLVSSSKVAAPKYRLGPAVRTDPLQEKALTTPRFDVVKREPGDTVFRLSFEPALTAGEVVDYSFYIWAEKIYAMSRREAIERYKDEWTREGIVVNDPSLFFSITVKLAEGFGYREARIEKDPVLTHGGPNVPGSVISSIKLGEKVLKAEVQKPSVGTYFVSWKAP